MNRRSFFGTLAGAIVAQPVALHLSDTMPTVYAGFGNGYPISNIAVINTNAKEVTITAKANEARG
jgi:hypothetical protein